MLLIVKSIVLILALVVSLSSAAEENLRVPQNRDLTFCWWPYVWENNQCKYCTNSYVCPANSCRVSWSACYDDFDDCQCNHGYYKSPYDKTCLPVKPPTPAPVAASVCKNDYVCPANSCRIPNQACYDSFDDCQCNSGFYKSRTEPKCIPITAAPVKPPTKAPRKPPTAAPVKPPTKAPRRPPVAVPVKPPTYAPVKPPTKAPRRPPTNAPVKPPTKAPVKPPTQAPVKCPYPQQWIDGCCKDVCKNDYSCPYYSYKSAYRTCCDSFDDCECKYGFYKSAHEAKCIRYWWCTWW